jgi:predicted MFS family arabinose efflux permease
LDSLSFFISALLIFLISKRASSLVQGVNLKEVSRGLVEAIRKSVFHEIKDGIAYFVRNKDIRFTSGVMFTLMSALGAVYVVLIVFVQKTLHSQTKDLGLLVMFLGIGLFFGSLIYGRFGQRISQYKTIFASLVLSGAMLIVFCFAIYNYPYFLVATTLALVMGIVIAPIMVASNTIIHKASDNEMLGKVFSSMEIVMHLGFLLAMFVSSLLAERFSHLYILVAIGCIFSLVGVINLIIRRKIPWLE